jgi:hypothetical protein
MRITRILLAVICTALFCSESFGEEQTNAVRTVVAKMYCSCGGEMKPTGICYVTYPASYEHKCDRCGKTAEYRTSYPELRYEYP